MGFSGTKMAFQENSPALISGEAGKNRLQVARDLSRQHKGLNNHVAEARIF